MKPLNNLNNVERAKLLFELHPAQIPAFIKYATEVLNRQLADVTDLKANWNNGMISAEYWIGLMFDLRKQIVKYNPQISKSKALFSDQLFDGFLALITTTILGNYIAVNKDTKFNLTVQLLFM